MSKLSTRAVQDWLVDLSKRERDRDKKLREKDAARPARVLSVRTVAYCRAALSIVVSEGFRHGVVQQVVVAGTKLVSEATRRRRAESVSATGKGSEPEDRAVRLLSADEVSKLLGAAAARTARLDGNAFDGHRDHIAPYWELALESGRQPSEMLGLRWRDVELDW